MTAERKATITIGAFVVFWIIVFICTGDPRVAFGITLIAMLSSMVAIWLWKVLVFFYSNFS